MIKRFVTVTLLCLLIFLLVGCTENSIEKQGNDALEYIGNKYDREFKPISYDASEFASDADEVECYTDGMDVENGEIARVYVEGKEFQDNYFGYLIRDEEEKYIEDFVHEEYSECKVYVDVENYPLPNELTQKNTLKDLYQSDPDYCLCFCAFVCREGAFEEDEEKVNRIMDALVQTGHRFDVQLFVIEKSVFDNIQRYHTDFFFDDYFKNRESYEGLVYEWQCYLGRGEVK